MTKKKFYITAISLLTIILAVIAFFIGFGVDGTSKAKVILQDEITALTDDIDKLEIEKENINTQIADINSELSTKTTINNYFMEAKKKNDALKNSINDLKQKSNELDEKLKDKGDTSTTVSQGKETGKTYTIAKDKTYSCPSDVPSGRYTAKGKGNFIISSGGKTKSTVDLTVAYNNSYTFTLSEGENVKSTDEVILSEIK